MYMYVGFAHLFGRIGSKKDAALFGQNATLAGATPYVGRPYCPPGSGRDAVPRRTRWAEQTGSQDGGLGGPQTPGARSPDRKWLKARAYGAYGPHGACRMSV